MISSLLGRAFQFIIALVSVRMMTTVLSPIEVGKVSLINTLVNFCVLVLICPFGNFVNRRIHSWAESGRIKAYFGWYVQYLFVVATVCAFLAVLAVWAGWLPLAVEVSTLGVVMWGAILFGSIHQTLIPSLNLLGRVHAFAILSVLSPALGLGLSWLFIRFGGQPVATQWLAGIVVSQLVFSIVAARVFFYRDTSKIEPRIRINNAMITKAWQFAWPVSIAVACSWLHFQGYRFVLADSVGLEGLGFFVAGYGIAASLFSALELILTTWFMPRFYRQVNQVTRGDSASAWACYASSVLPLSMLAFAALFSVSDVLVQLMLGPAFQNTQQYVRWGALAEWTRVVAGIYVLVAHQHMRTRDLVIPHILGAVVAFVIIIWWGASGRLDIVPAGLAVGNVLVIGVLRWTQGDAARLLSGTGRLIFWVVALSSFVFGLDIFLRWIGNPWWTPQTIERAVAMCLIWSMVGLYMLRRVLSSVRTEESM